MLNANGAQGLLIPCHVCECGLIEGCELHDMDTQSAEMHSGIWCSKKLVLS